MNNLQLYTIWMNHTTLGARNQDAKEHMLYDFIHTRKKKQSKLWDANRSEEHRAYGDADNAVILDLSTWCMDLFSVWKFNKLCACAYTCTHRYNILEVKNQC